MPDLSFPCLAAPITLRGVHIRNRIVMAPMCAMYAMPDGSATTRTVEYYRARARGGTGLVIVEITFSDDGASRAFHAQLGAHSDLMIPGLNEVAEAIKAEGAVAGLQLGHCGSQRVISEPPIVAPSPIPWAAGKRVPKELTTSEIEALIETHAQAARRVVAAGFDLIELHGAHGYLINTFLCPATNHRTDAYGGSLENRLRFPLAIVGAVRQALGNKRLLSFRLNGDDLLSGGLGIEEYCLVARHLASSGVDIVHVSAGTYRVMEQRIAPMYIPEAPFIGYAGPIRRASGLPVIASGSIHDPNTAEALIADGDADFVSMARPLFADPDLAGKLLSNRRAEILPCIRCNTCLGREQSGWRGLCAVNPRTGSEQDIVRPAQAARRVLVIGAGPSGIQAALTARARGHIVELLEREDAIGGKLRIAAGLPFKPTIALLLEYWRSAVAESGIDVSLGVEAPRCDSPDVVVMATGAKRVLPEGLKNSGATILGAEDALQHLEGMSGPVLVLGATTVGAETAWRLAELGHPVTLADEGGDFSDDVNLIARIVFNQRFSALGIELVLKARITAVDGSTIRLEVNGHTQTRDFATVVLTTPPMAAFPLPLADSWRQTGAKVFTVGECAGHAGIIGATRSGYWTASEI